MNFLQTKNNNFITNNKTVKLKGVGLGNWLNLEHFMFGLPGTDSQIRKAIKDVYGTEKYDQFWDKYYSTYISEEDIEYIHKLGLNHVRIPINHNLFFTDNNFEKSIAISQINRILPYLKKYKVWGIIDLHTAPGGQNPDWHSDNYSGKENFWNDEDAINNMANLWGKIAKHYKDEPAIGGYDLINEPCFFDTQSEINMINYFKNCTTKIREVDSNHIIFYSGNTYSRDFSMFTNNLDENSSYTFHLYPFLQIPEHLESKEIHNKLETSLYEDVSFKHLTENLKKPLWCGETGHPLHLPNTYNALTKFISILETKKIGWALWPFKDNGAMGLIHTKEDSKWNKLCSQLSNNWIFWNIFTKDSFLSTQNEKNKYSYYNWLANESTKAWEVVYKNLKKLPFEKLYDALDDFNFNNCSINTNLILNKK